MAMSSTQSPSSIVSNYQRICAEVTEGFKRVSEEIRNVIATLEQNHGETGKTLAQLLKQIQQLEREKLHQVGVNMIDQCEANVLLCVSFTLDSTTT
jgi:cell shape-determining protein MreC